MPELNWSNVLTNVLRLFELGVGVKCGRELNGSGIVSWPSCHSKMIHNICFTLSYLQRRASNSFKILSERKTTCAIHVKANVVVLTRTEP